MSFSITSGRHGTLLVSQASLNNSINSSIDGSPMWILNGTRRRNASSTNSSGWRLVEKRMVCSKGTQNFLPVGRFRKSCLLSNGMIHRFRSSAGATRCRPKSSISKQPQLLFIWSGASQILLRGSCLISRLSSVSSPPTTTVGRRILSQRRSCSWFAKIPEVAVGVLDAI